MLNNYLAMSLAPRQSLSKILYNVALEQWRQTDRLALVLPLDETLSYYESNLLRDVIVVEQGLIMPKAFSLATKDSAFPVFRAITLLMPQPKPVMAIKCKLEASHIAISENNDNTAFLTQYDLSRCIGSSRYQICLELIGTE